MSKKAKIIIGAILLVGIIYLLMRKKQPVAITETEKKTVTSPVATSDMPTSASASQSSQIVTSAARAQAQSDANSRGAVYLGSSLAN